MLKIPTKMVDFKMNRDFILKKVDNNFHIYHDTSLVGPSRTKYVLLTNIVGNSFCEDVTKIVLGHSIFEDGDIILEREFLECLDNVYTTNAWSNDTEVKTLGLTTKSAIILYAIRTQQILSMEVFKAMFPEFHYQEQHVPTSISQSEQEEIKQMEEGRFWERISEWRDNQRSQPAHQRKTTRQLYRVYNNRNGKPYGEDEISKEVDRYFAAKEDNLFQTSEIGVKVVTQPVDFTSGNADTKKTMKSYQHFASAHLDFYAPKDIKQVREKVLKKYPYTQPVLDKILARTYRLQSFGKNRLQIPPTLIWGTAGSGKSTFLRMLMKELGSFTSSVNIGGDGDDHWLGLSKGFSTGHPSMVLTSLKDSNVINPSFIVDELDKQPPKKEYNNTQDKLLKLLEPSEAENWRETYTGMYLNTSHINWLFTANDIDRIEAPLKSRLQVVRMPLPQKEDVPVLMSNLREEIAAQDEMDVRWYPDFNTLETEAVQNSWDDHKNLRILKRQVEQILNDKFMNLAACVN